MFDFDQNIWLKKVKFLISLHVYTPISEVPQYNKIIMIMILEGLRMKNLVPDVCPADLAA